LIVKQVAARIPSIVHGTMPDAICPRSTFASG